jgi:DNA-directed RNA polymerase specialized sigma24 family protein
MEQFGPALDRLARAYEADPEKRRDLSQDIHLQLWRSFQKGVRHRSGKSGGSSTLPVVLEVDNHT